ncbi:rhomboid family intramembrane serine protease [Allorhodopirellula solitaria]|uniref:Rhomboid family protein n=1 Tax=Allorhodopirellula solitaria TaxID=2527987 RepID=A0A5C5YFK1_9BACT|nr:rhomboid family intramembrane serine protease [Allorhodopirellula solitaria]TWT73251.1 Rhomboid family protein [Allorhodopirellula solitaria]
MPPPIYQSAVFVAVMWGVFLLDLILPGSFLHYGLVPRTARGLPGIALMPFLHANYAHLLSNTIPIAILLALTLSTRPQAWASVIAIMLCSGALLWCFGRPANHVGASGLVFGLTTFLIIVGVREKQFLSLGVAVAVGLIFGGSLLSGIIPSFGSNVSWDGHLCGAIAGVVVGIATTERAESFL